MIYCKESRIDEVVKSLSCRHPGGRRGPERPEKRDSGFRRNDGKRNKATFYEFIKPLAIAGFGAWVGII
jgi:hypothetical protein